MQVALQQIVVSPGQQLLLKNVSWQQFQEILASLGANRNSRIAYSQGMLEIIVPLPEHESDKVIIGDLVKAILEEIDIEFRSLGSTTFENEQMLAVVEPDDCFYIQNEAAIRGKKRLNFKVDPPPDLAIEIDITSKTKLAIYQNLRVPELWRYNGQKLEINLLQSGNLDLKQYPPPDLAIEADVTSKTTLNSSEAMGVPEVWIYRNQQLKIYLLSDRGYTETSISPTFPDLPIIELIPQLVQKAIDEGTSKMLRDLRTENWIL
ncbi:MAG: Uma2 family endonuclease [Phormidium sp.]